MYMNGYAVEFFGFQMDFQGFNCCCVRYKSATSCCCSEKMNRCGICRGEIGDGSEKEMAHVSGTRYCSSSREWEGGASKHDQKVC